MESNQFEAEDVFAEFQKNQKPLANKIMKKPRKKPKKNKKTILQENASLEVIIEETTKAGMLTENAVYYPSPSRLYAPDEMDHQTFTDLLTRSEYDYLDFKTSFCSPSLSKDNFYNSIVDCVAHCRDLRAFLKTAIAIHNAPYRSTPGYIIIGVQESENNKVLVGTKDIDDAVLPPLLKLVVNKPTITMKRVKDFTYSCTSPLPNISTKEKKPLLFLVFEIAPLSATQREKLYVCKMLRSFSGERPLEQDEIYARDRCSSNTLIKPNEYSSFYARFSGIEEKGASSWLDVNEIVGSPYNRHTFLICSEYKQPSELARLASFPFHGCYDFDCNSSEHGFLGQMIAKNCPPSEIHCLGDGDNAATWRLTPRTRKWIFPLGQQEQDAPANNREYGKHAEEIRNQFIKPIIGEVNPIPIRILVLWALDDNDKKTAMLLEFLKSCHEVLKNASILFVQDNYCLGSTCMDFCKEYLIQYNRFSITDVCQLIEKKSEPLAFRTTQDFILYEQQTSSIKETKKILKQTLDECSEYFSPVSLTSLSDRPVANEFMDGPIEYFFQGKRNLTWAEVKQCGNHANRDKEKAITARLLELVDISGSIVKECRLYYEPGSGGDVVAKAALLDFMSQKRGITILHMYHFRETKRDDILHYIDLFCQSGQRLVLFCDATFEGVVANLKDTLERNKVKVILFSLYKTTDCPDMYFKLPEYFESETETARFYQFYSQRCSTTNKKQFIAEYGATERECINRWQAERQRGKSIHSGLIHFSPVFMCLFAKEADFTGIASYVNSKLKSFQQGSDKSLLKYVQWMTIVSFMQYYNNGKGCNPLTLATHCLKAWTTNWTIVDEARNAGKTIEQSFDLFLQETATTLWKTRHRQIALKILEYFKDKWSLNLLTIGKEFIRCFKGDYDTVNEIFFENDHKLREFKLGLILYDLRETYAEPLLKELVKEFPSNPFVLANFGRFLSEIKDGHQEAEQKIKKAIEHSENKLEPQKLSVLFNMLGVVYQKWLLATNVNDIKLMRQLFKNARDFFQEARDRYSRNRHAYISYVTTVTQLAEKIKKETSQDLSEYLETLDDDQLKLSDCISEADDILDQFNALFVIKNQNDSSPENAVAIYKECRVKLEICRDSLQNLEEVLRKEADSTNNHIAKYYYVTQMLKYRKNFNCMFTKHLLVFNTCKRYLADLLQSISGQPMNTYRTDVIYSCWFRIIRFGTENITNEDLAQLANKWQTQTSSPLAKMYTHMFHLERYLLSKNTAKPQEDISYNNNQYKDDQVEFLVSLQNDNYNMKNFVNKADTPQPELVWITQQHIKLTLNKKKNRVNGPHAISLRIFSRIDKANAAGQANSVVKVQLAFTRAGPVVTAYKGINVLS